MEQDSTHKCVQCSIVDKEVKATMFCVICVDHLCDTCSKIHSKSKATRTHKLLSGDEVPINTDAFSGLATVLSCKLHPEIDVQFECIDHHEFICGLCLRNSHRQCENVEEIEEFSDFNTGIEKCIVVRERAKDLGKKLTSAKRAHDENVKKYLQEEKRLSEERQSLMYKIRDLFIVLDAQYANEIQANVKYNTINSFATAEKEHSSVSELLELSVKYADNKQLKVVTSKANQAVSLVIHEIDMLEMKKRQFQPLESKQECLNKIIKMLQLEVSHQQMPTKSDFDRGHDEILDTEPAQLAKNSASENSCQNKTVAKLPEKKKTSIKECKKKADVPLFERAVMLIENWPIQGNLVDLALLLDGRYVCLVNKSIAVYSKSFELTASLNLDATPIAVCLIEDTSIAVVYASKKMVDLFQIQVDTVVRCGVFNTKLYCHALTKHGDNIAILCVDKDNDNDINSNDDVVEIQIRNKKGTLLQVINNFTYSSGEPVIFHNPKCIKSIKNKEILIGDKAKLRCFRKYGVCKWFVKSHTAHFIHDITGLTIDEEGNIYMCGYNSNNLHQVCSNDYKKQRVLVPTLDRPMNVVYDTVQQRLVVGCGDNTMKVYKLV